jgi:hypothetical protein
MIVYVYNFRTLGLYGKTFTAAAHALNISEHMGCAISGKNEYVFNKNTEEHFSFIAH